MRKAVFLDRDGVINKKPPKDDYVKSLDEFFLLPKSLCAIKLLKEKGYLVIVVTNQRGIARGLVSQETINKIHQRLEEVDSFYVCPHSNEDNCQCRKPRPGLIKKAATDLRINLSKSFLIGDDESDRQAALNAGIPKENITIMAPNNSLLKATKTLNL